MNNNLNLQTNVALVGTPCHIIAAEKMDHYAEVLGRSPIDFKLGLFCMENFSHLYLKNSYQKNIKIEDIDEFQVEKDTWAYLNNGNVFELPLSCQEFYAKTAKCADCPRTGDSQWIIGSIGVVHVIGTEKGLRALQKLKMKVS